MPKTGPDPTARGPQNRSSKYETSPSAGRDSSFSYVVLAKTLITILNKRIISSLAFIKTYFVAYNVANVRDSIVFICLSIFVEWNIC